MHQERLSATSDESLSDRLTGLHARLQEFAPAVDRVACALYDPADDTLRTFVSSTTAGEPLVGYRYRLSDSESLSYLARTREVRHLVDIPGSIVPSTEHSAWLLDQGFRSSVTVPLFDHDRLLGFAFFDSRRADAFPPQVQRELVLFGTLVGLEVVNELAAVRTVIGTVQMARDFTLLRDFETGEQLVRMSRLARLIGERLIHPLGLTDLFVEHVHLYAPLHDIGKIGIPDRILLKPGPLDEQEWEVMRTHTTKGRDMAETIMADVGFPSLPEPQVMLNIVELHHEKLDGSGYPHGLVGEQIPLESRIVAVADIFDALMSRRPYKGPWEPTAAVAELRSMARQGLLDPRCVSVLADGLDEALAVYAEVPDAYDEGEPHRT